MNATTRLYRTLSRLLLPDGFSDAFAEELRAVYAEVDREARERGGAAGAWRALAAELPGLVKLAIRERRTLHTRRAPRASARLEENVFDSLRLDVAFAARALRRTPGFTLIAISTLALGVGANTAIFSLVHGVLLSPLKLGDPQQLVAIGEQSKSIGLGAISSTSPGSFFEWKTASRTLRMGAYTTTVNRTLTGFGEPQQLAGTGVVGGTMEVLGVPPLFGRQLTVADEEPAAPPVLMLSYDAWHRLFGENRDVLGRTLTLNGTPRTIVGVMPPGFTFPGAPNDFWSPSQFDAGFRANRDQYFLSAVGRFAPGVTLEQAQREMNGIMARLTREWPKYNEGSLIVVKPLQDTIVGAVRPRLLVLMGAVAFVLLITCVNIVNLLLARAAGRGREIAVRRALGASGGRIARQLVTEALVLATLGGVAGVLAAKLFLRLLLAAQETINLPRADEIALDGRVLLFTLGVSVAAGVVFGAIPAWHLTRARSADALREGARASAGHHWTRSTMVVAELALAMVLLVGAGLLLRSFELMRRVDPGFRPDNVVVFGVNRRTGDAPFFLNSLERIRALPGVRMTSLTSRVPVSGRGIGAWFNRIDRPLPGNVQPTGEPYRVVTPEYFATVGIPLRLGRLLDSHDRLDAPAIVVNEALVRKYYPNESPLGKPVYLGAPDNRLFDSAPIVGVVGDTRDMGLGSEPLPTVYIPFAMMPKWPIFSYVIRTNGDAAAVARSARQIVRELDPSLPIGGIHPLDEVVSAATAPARWSTTLLGVFAAIALVTAVLGVFGVLSYVVSQRTREVGIRIALGASSGAVRRLIVGRGLRLIVTGLTLGWIGSLALTRYMSSLLYGVTPTDRLTFAAVGLLLAGASLAASYLPARRATRVDPVIALRAE